MTVRDTDFLSPQVHHNHEGKRTEYRALHCRRFPINIKGMTILENHHFASLICINLFRQGLSMDTELLGDRLLKEIVTPPQSYHTTNYFLLTKKKIILPHRDLL
jgi:hypothetical protein